MIGSKSFVKERLVQAREARMMTATNLADLLGVSLATISSYEHGRQKPPVESLERLGAILNVSNSFFFTEVPSLTEERIFFRSMASAAKGARNRAKRRYEWLQEVVMYLEGHFDLPVPDVPDCGIPIDFRRIDSEQIEDAATACRQHWGISNGPCPNLVRLSESKGILVSRGKLEAEGLDAFSQWSDVGRPIAFLGSDKASAVRSRFDLAHEIGHLVLHRHVNDAAIASSKDYKLIENQAHRFASAFLLPAQDFSLDLYAPTLDAFRLLKPKWKVSIGAMIMRSSDLGIVDENALRRLWINMNRRGWRTHEPLDESIEPEQPSLMAQCLNMMIDESFKSKEQILSDLRISPSDIEELCGLNRGFLTKEHFLPVAKPKFLSSGQNILPFNS